jgi:hypothetical protein
MNVLTFDGIQTRSYIYNGSLVVYKGDKMMSVNKTLALCKICIFIMQMKEELLNGKCNLIFPLTPLA